MTSGAPDVATAYDAIAVDYDRLVAEDRWMRDVLWSHYRSAFAPGTRLLEVGCGTGLDTLFLAERGHDVVAIDVSPGMIDQLRAKLDHSPARDRVEPRVQDGGALASFPKGDFDGLLAAFAAVNTVGDLSGFAAQAARLLRPGGRMVLHLLAPAGIWERRKAAREDGRHAARELRRRRERTLTIAGQPVCHRVLAPAEARRCFTADFSSRRTYGLGFLWPRDRSGRIDLGIARRLGWLEARLGSLWPFVGWGRFFVLDLERR